jgi:hypothetical protein
MNVYKKVLEDDELMRHLHTTASRIVKATVEVMEAEKHKFQYVVATEDGHIRVIDLMDAQELVFDHPVYVNCPKHGIQQTDSILECPICCPYVDPGS